MLSNRRIRFHPILGRSESCFLPSKRRRRCEGEEGYDSSRHPFYCPNSFMMDAFVTERTFI